MKKKCHYQILPQLQQSHVDIKIIWLTRRTYSTSPDTSMIVQKIYTVLYKKGIALRQFLTTLGCQLKMSSFNDLFMIGTSNKNRMILLSQLYQLLSKQFPLMNR